MIALDNNRIDAMAADARLAAEFPFVRLTKPGANGCCGRAGPRRDYDTIKTTLAHLPPHSRRRLKELLGAGEVVVYYPDQKGGVGEVRF